MHRRAELPWQMAVAKHLRAEGSDEQAANPEPLTTDLTTIDAVAGQRRIPRVN
jgi:hypothetical protein